MEYNEIEFLKLKNKSESEYNAIIIYNNFYPNELSFNNDNNVEKVKFNTNYSSYETKFWEDPSFPNMQIIFSLCFKHNLKEKQNKK